MRGFLPPRHAPAAQATDQAHVRPHTRTASRARRPAPHVRDHLPPRPGKTTLTEKLLLFAGAIQIAGSVKARKATRHATSDWMEIEKQRGISVASSVMQMEYREKVLNLLDTPGHQISRKTPIAC